MNEFEKSRDRIVKWVEPQDNWTEEDWEHYRTVIKALDKQIPKKLKIEKHNHIFVIVDISFRFTLMIAMLFLLTIKLLIALIAVRL